MDPRLKRASATFLAEVDENELAIRLIEAHASIIRPAGKTPRELLNAMPSDAAVLAIAQARAAILYMAECFGKAVKPQ